MKILLRLPTWLGDAVMLTPSFTLLQQTYPQATFTIVGSKVSTELFARHSCVKNIYIDESKKAKNRFLALYQLAKTIGKHDIAITFQNNFPSAFLLFCTKTPIRIGFSGNFRSLLLTHALKPQKSLHQVEQYALLLQALHITPQAPLKLFLHSKPIKKQSHLPRIGINAGAKYGSAKRWCEGYFIEVMSALLTEGYEVILYGSQEEKEANTRITQTLKHHQNAYLLQDLTAETTITQLVDSIASLDLFITNDSGPMHIASSLSVPLIAIFGPTDSKETSPYNQHNKQIILSKHLPCSPCKKRECPLKHHQCMKLITPDEVLNNVFAILQEDKNKR